MIIGIDGNEANLEKRVGTNQYAFELLWSFYRIVNRLGGDKRFLIYLKSMPNGDLPPENDKWNYKVIKGGGKWILTRLMPSLWTSEKPDVFFSPNHYLPPLARVPKVCTIHDLGYLYYSEQFKKYDFWQLKYWTAISIFVSKCIITVSKSTEKDIVRHYPNVANKVQVIYHGYDKKRFKKNINVSVVRRVRKKYKIPKNYILYLGTFKPSKNVEGLVEAFKLLTVENKDLALVIAGKKGWLYGTIYEKVKSLELEDRVVFTGYVDEDDKPALMKGAVVFTSPSFWEGFGIPVLESMACGTPVVVSRIASLPEVAGDAGIYVDPSNFKSIYHGMKKVLDFSDKEYSLQSEKVLERSKKFSWKKSAEKTAKILMEAAK
jgi:glycosyltransferase involved in cell wall biosynthesis